MEIRDEILDAVIKEIVGPSINPNYIDEETGEEILIASVHGSPKSRYGAGMLYPQHSAIIEEDDSESHDVNEFEAEIDIPKMDEIRQSSAIIEEGQSDEEPVGLANQYLPSAMGFTVRFNASEKNDLVKIKINSAFYQRGKDKKPKKHIGKDNKIDITEINGAPFLSDSWVRRPINPDEINLNINSLFNDSLKSYDEVIKKNESGKSWLKLRIFNRTTTNDKNEGFLTYTFVLINDIQSTTDDSVNSGKILYQNYLSITTENNSLIAPYKEKKSQADTDEEKELNLLYRRKRIFAIGHGTSVSWVATLNGEYEVVKKIETSIISNYDLPQVAPTAFVQLSMLELSDLGDWNKAKTSLKKLASEYGSWIEKIDDLARNSSELDKYRDAALANVLKCRASFNRIQKGINYLLEADEDSELVKCFRWMNRSMIWQQQRSKTKIRKWVKSGKGKSKQLVLEGISGDNSQYKFKSIKEYHELSEYNGRWRPFQLAFILMNINSIVNPTCNERSIVDLIWFPTGGGKTEAYLGLTAFNIFYRRFKGKEQWNWDFFGGTTVIMRYTLRLLTTQQYERASSLICACDLIRKENEEFLGTEQISIGLWVGGSSTPNDNEKATVQLNALKRDVKAPYNFVVMKCPCCGAQIGKIDNAGKYDTEKIKGIFKEDGRNGVVKFKCENITCEYSGVPLPLQVVDDLIYETSPTLLLGTVDKFAMIPWKKDAGRLFGFRECQDQKYSRIAPPDLIIQDELHLIAGPLGTMVGLYETMIQTLCNNYNKSITPFITEKESDFIPPKIIASSATISRSFEQVKSLYGIKGATDLNIFPAQGLEFGDTWFSEEKSLNEIDSSGKQKFPGRKYVGILASGYPSAQTSIVRSYSAVLQKIKELSLLQDDDDIDYYWTLLGYFNSIRELGGASSLVYGDIRERLGQIQNRDLIEFNHRRYLNKIEELTSRISSSEIPTILKKLEESFTSIKNKSLDICLATNMVATGVDISRLGLMFIHGQPKTTAEYIQASSRVGRDLPSGPGIIFTLYSPAKPRDKSQYEQFQGYHSRIYSNVEPTSVTPFSINSRERGLHAILIGMVRHFSSGTLRDNPTITAEFDEIVEVIKKIIIERCKTIDEEEVDNTIKLLNKRIKFWKDRGFQSYGDAGNYKILKDDSYFPLMYASSAEVRDEIIRHNRSIPTPTSMRGVDTESVLSIYSNLEPNDR